MKLENSTITGIPDSLLIVKKNKRLCLTKKPTTSKLESQTLPQLKQFLKDTKNLEDNIKSKKQSASDSNLKVEFNLLFYEINSDQESSSEQD